MYGQYMPIIMLTVATFTLIEAAGAADEYPALKGTSKVKLEILAVLLKLCVCNKFQVEKTTAAICQRTLLIILPLTFASFVCGTIATYEQVRGKICDRHCVFNIYILSESSPVWRFHHPQWSPRRNDDVLSHHQQ